MKILQKNLLSMVRQLTSIPDDDMPVKAFEVLEKYKTKLKKYLTGISQDFPADKICGYTAISSDSYHFASEEESLDLHIALIENYGEIMVRILFVCYDANKKEICRGKIQDFFLEPYT